MQVDTNNSNDNNHAISYEIVFDSIFVIFSQTSERIYRVGGTTYNNLAASKFYTLSAGGNGITTSYKDSKTVSNAAITTICSMDFYGLFLGIEGATKVVRLELNIGTDGDAAMETVTRTANLLDIDSINYYEMATTSTFRLLQTKGWYGRHRPCYMVNSDQPTQLKRLTTQITTFFPDPVVPNPIDLFTTDWSEGVVKQGA